MKKERFCQEIHIDMNRIEAVIRTGCWKAEDSMTGEKVTLDPKNADHRTKASAIASRLMLDPEVIIRINELESMRNLYVKLEATRIRERFQHVAFDFEPDEGPSWKEVIAAAKELAKFDGTLYVEDNKQRADAIGKMFNDIFATKDDLPKLGNAEETDGSGEPDTQDSAEACG
jgi:hypothetical protein